MKQFAKSIALFLTVSLFIATVIAGDKRNDETRRSTAVKTATQKGALKDIPITVTKKTNITNPIGQKCFFSRVRRRIFFEPMTDQQIRTDTHQFPEHVHGN